MEWPKPSSLDDADDDEDEHYDADDHHHHYRYHYHHQIRRKGNATTAAQLERRSKWTLELSRVEMETR